MLTDAAAPGASVTRCCPYFTAALKHENPLLKGNKLSAQLACLNVAAAVVHVDPILSPKLEAGMCHKYRVDSRPLVSCPKGRGTPIRGKCIDREGIFILAIPDDTSS